MATLLIVLVVLVGAAVLAVVAGRRAQAAQLERSRAELEPVKKLANEDVTAFGVDLQDLDAELLGRELDAGARADYQRALDAYESAKVAVTRINKTTT